MQLAIQQEPVICHWEVRLCLFNTARGLDSCMLFRTATFNSRLLKISMITFVVFTLDANLLETCA